MRRPYIDWLRGVAVVFMIEWHAIDAWTKWDVREGAAWKSVAFIGGWAAPLFLFLAGVSVALAAAAQLRKGASLREASWALQKRGWQIFALAHLFRFQSFLFNPSARWHSLLKPDILNILGLGMVAAAFCWGRGDTPRRRALWLIAPVAGVLLLTPLSRGWWWPTLLHPRFEAYIRPVAGNWGQFSIFPWIAFVFAGAFIGSLIASPRPVEDEPHFHARLARLAFGILAVGAIAMWIPSPFAQSSFWTTSASWFLIRVGCMTLGLWLAWLWMRRPGAGHWSPMLVFGQTSLFVYWIHVEIAYGVLTYPLRQALTLGWAVVAYVIFALLLLGAATLWLRREPGRPWIPAHMRAPG